MALQDVYIKRKDDGIFKEIDIKKKHRQHKEYYDYEAEENSKARGNEDRDKIVFFPVWTYKKNKNQKKTTKKKRKKIYSLLEINNFEIINIKADGLFKKRDKKFNLPDLETLLNGWGGDAHFYPVAFDNVLKFKFNLQRFEFSYSYIPQDEDINFKKEGSKSSNKFYSFWFLDIRERIHEVLKYRSENPDAENPFASKVSGFNKGIMDSDNVHVDYEEEKSSKSSKSSQSDKKSKEEFNKEDEIEFKKFEKGFKKLDISADVMSDEKKNDEKKNAMRNKRKSLRQNRLTLRADDENGNEYRYEEDDRRSRKYSIVSDASYRKSMIVDNSARNVGDKSNRNGDD